MIKLSIIIPAYNCEKYIEKCINSITREIDEHIELIIIDDGSKDNTLSKCKNYNMNNIIIISNTNHGASYSRNIGIDKAVGEYIMFVDSDDYLSTGWKQTVFDAIKTKKDIICFSKDYADYDLPLEVVINSIFGINKNIKWVSPPWSKIFKRSFLNKYRIRFKDGIINGEDMLFNAEAFLNCSNYCFINNSIYNYRYCSSSITKSFNEKIFESDVRFQNELAKISNNKEQLIVNIQHHCIENAIIMFIRKLSMLSFKEANKYYYIFKRKPYNDYINNKKGKSLKNNIIIQLIKKKKYKTAIMFMKIKSKFKRRKEFDYFIDI